MATPLFREASLQKLSSPEQLDQLLRVTRPKGWLALAAVGLILAAALIWSIVGQIATNVPGQGILIVEGELLEVVADSSGPLTDIFVKDGQEVQPGQLVARISQPDLIDAIQKSRAERLELGAQQEVLTKLGRLTQELELKTVAVQRDTLKITLANSQARQTELDSLVRKQQALLSQRLIVEQQLLTTQQQLDAVVKEIGQSEVQFKELITKEEKLKETLKADILARDLKIHNVDRQIKELEEKLEQTGKVICPFAGRVAALRAARHAVVQPGTPILALTPLGDPARNLQALLYVDAEQGKRIQPGMSAEVSPSTVKRERHGYLVGQVLSVSELPASSETMMARLENKEIVDELMKKLGVVLEVRIALRADAATASGYQWSSPKGPPLKITEGTLCSARITVEEQRPIALVIPLFKKELGLD